MIFVWLFRTLFEKNRKGISFALAAGARKEFLIPGIPLLLLLEGGLLALILEASLSPVWVVLRRGSLAEADGFAGYLAAFYLVFAFGVGVVPLAKSYINAPKERRWSLGLLLVGVTVFPFAFCTVAALGPGLAVEHNRYVVCWQGEKTDRKGREIAYSVYARQASACPPQGAFVVDVDRPAKER